MMLKKLYFVCPLLLIILFSQSFFSQTPTPTPPDAEEDTIKVFTTLIRVDVVVTDKNKKQVTNLKTDDFEVYENGVKQEVTSFTYVSSKSENRVNPADDDSLNLQSDRDGLGLSNKIKVPTITRPVDAGSVRRTFVLVVDNLGLNFQSVNAVKRALKKFINEQIKEGDLATIVTTSGSRVLPPFTSDKKELLSIVKRLKWSPQSRGGADSYEPIRNTLLEEMSESRGQDLPGVKQEAAHLEDVERSRNNNSATGTIGSLNYIVNGMGDLPGRKAMILFSEGFSISEQSSQQSSSSNAPDPNGVPTSPPSINNRFGSGVSNALESLIQTANQNSVVIYAIDPRGLQNLSMANADDDITKSMGRDFKPGQTGDKRTSRDDYFRQTQDGLRVLATETGGFAVVNQSDLDKGLRNVIDDQSYYLLSYISNIESADSPKDAIGRVEIKVKDPNHNVRYRNAFYSEGSRSNNPGTAQTPREKIGQALAFPFRANEIALNLYSITGHAESVDFVRFLINISAKDLEFKREGKDSRTANIDMLAITLDGNGKPVNQFVKNFNITVNEATYRNILKRGFVYNLPVVLKKSGIYHFRIAIRDSITGKVGAASQFVETPKFEKKNLWISNLTLTSVPTSNAAELKTDNRVYTDSTLREFGLPVTLHYGAEVYNAKTNENPNPNLTIQTRLILNDKVILETEPKPVSTEGQTDSQRIELFGRIQINKNLAPGNYIFQIIVIDTLANTKTQTATQWIDFEVVGN